jgi:hypothetical protein
MLVALDEVSFAEAVVAFNNTKAFGFLEMVEVFAEKQTTDTTPEFPEFTAGSLHRQSPTILERWYLKISC